MKKSVAKLPSPKKIWRIWLGSQSPRRPILRWSSTDKLGLLMVCLLVAIISSYKLLAVPDLKPGDIAPINEIAPKDATVIDTQALKEKRKGLKESFVQVIDENQSENLQEIVLKQIKKLRVLKESNFQVTINKINSVVHLTKTNIWCPRISILFDWIRIQRSIYIYHIDIEHLI